MNVKIRKATIEDAREILNIYSPYITDTTVTFEITVPSLDEFKVRMENIIREYPYLVCTFEGKVIGYSYSSKHAEREAYKYSANVSVYITPEFQRKGIGKLLYSKLFEALKEKGICTVVAGITLPNDSSVGLHKSLGFNEVGTFHNIGYKFNEWLDVLWLEKSLDMK